MVLKIVFDNKISWLMTDSSRTPLVQNKLVLWHVIPKHDSGSTDDLNSLLCSHVCFFSAAKSITHLQPILEFGLTGVCRACSISIKTVASSVFGVQRSMSCLVIWFNCFCVNCNPMNFWYISWIFLGVMLLINIIPYLDMSEIEVFAVLRCFNFLVSSISTRAKCFALATCYPLLFFLRFL